MTSPADRLRSLADQATPAFPNRWKADLSVDPPRVRVLAPAGVWVEIPYDEHDARLIALAPDVARWAADAADELQAWSEWAERIVEGDDEGGFYSRKTDVLLARLGEIAGADE